MPKNPTSTRRGARALIWLAVAVVALSTHADPAIGMGALIMARLENTDA